MRAKPNAYCYTDANYQRNASTQCNSNANSDTSGYSDRDTYAHAPADAATED
jgi:hypothetical protein